MKFCAALSSCGQLTLDSLAELWNDELQSRKKRKDPFSPDKKKPVVVSDILSHTLWVFTLCSALKIAVSSVGGGHAAAHDAAALSLYRCF